MGAHLKRNCVDPDEDFAILHGRDEGLYYLKSIDARKLELESASAFA